MTKYFTSKISLMQASDGPYFKVRRLQIHFLLSSDLTARAYDSLQTS